MVWENFQFYIGETWQPLNQKIKIFITSNKSDWYHVLSDIWKRYPYLKFNNPKENILYTQIKENSTTHSISILLHIKW